MIKFKKLPENIDQKLEELREFLMGDSDILFAYLFGGMLRKRRNPLSDMDIAVFVKDAKRLDYLDLFGRITEILGTEEVDLIILNTSPLSILGRILQNRKVIADKNPFLRHRYESDNIRKYFDFMMKERDIMKRRYNIG